MKKIFILIFLILFSTNLFAIQEEFVKERGTNTTSLIFNTYFGARPVAMGGAFVGLADDASCVFYNPAGLAGLNFGYVSSGFRHIISDKMLFASLSVVVPPKDIGDTIGWGITASGMYKIGGIQGYDESGNPTQEQIVYGWMGMFSLATKIGDAFSKLGFNVKGYSQSFGKDSYIYGGAVDVGYHDNFWIIQFGAVLKDIISLHYNSNGNFSVADPFLKIGLAFTDADNAFGVSLDVGKNVLTADLPDLNLGGFLRLYKQEEDILEKLDEGEEYIFEEDDEIKFNDEIYFFIGFNKGTIFSTGLEFKFFGIKLDCAFIFPIEENPDISYYVNLDIHF